MVVMTENMCESIPHSVYRFYMNCVSIHRGKERTLFTEVMAGILQLYVFLFEDFGQ